MTDYIKRSDALNFEWEIDCEPDDLQPMMEGMARVMDYIKQIPTADVAEERVGTWTEKYVDDRTTELNPFMRRRFYCSACGEWNTHGKSWYCPNCGAKMYSSAESSETRMNRVDGGADNAAD